MAASFINAQVWSPPPVIATTPLVSPLTATGVNRVVVVPSPSWPLVLNPQQYAAPSFVTAQV
jgi:hypothetical protein